MAGESLSQVDPQDICEQLANWLALMEHAGVRELVMPGGPDAFESAARALADLARGAGAEAPDDAETAATPGAVAVSAAPGGGESRGGLGALLGAVGACRMCELHKGRTNTVFGEGNPKARLMFVGEGPGADEDAQGRPFVGRAGVLLTKIIEAMGLKREDVYIGNVVKCRPPGNRVPEPDEIASCLPYLEKQIDTISPEIICTLGNVATQTITGERRPISDMRGRTFEFRSIKVVPTYHPAACLRNPSCKKLVWDDVQVVMRYLGLPVRGVKRNGASANRA